MGEILYRMDSIVGCPSAVSQSVKFKRINFAYFTFFFTVFSPLDFLSNKISVLSQCFALTHSLRSAEPF